MLRIRNKHLVILLSATLFLAAVEADACVGKTITIAVSDSLSEKILAQLVAVLLNERTGTQVEVKTYANTKNIFDAVTKGEAGILIGNTRRALSTLGERKTLDSKETYSVSKAGYRKRFSLIWLESLGPVDNGVNQRHQYGPVITVDIMRDFPALPRVINKLAGVLEGGVLSEMIEDARSGKTPKSIARDYLLLKRLI